MPSRVGSRFAGAWAASMSSAFRGNKSCEVLREFGWPEPFDKLVIALQRIEP